jgi:hypothetical protein
VLVQNFDKISFQQSPVCGIISLLLPVKFLTKAANSGFIDGYMRGTMGQNATLANH